MGPRTNDPSVKGAMTPIRATSRALTPTLASSLMLDSRPIWNKSRTAPSSARKETSSDERNVSIK